MTERRIDPSDVLARITGLIASAVVVAGSFASLQADPSDMAWPTGHGAPPTWYLAVYLCGAAGIGLIGVVTGSRPVLGAAGGLILPLGLMSLLVIPAVLLIAACGLLPSRRRPLGRELAGGLLVVLLGLASFLMPGLLTSSRCRAEIEDARGTRIEFTDGMAGGIPGQTSTTCVERLTEPVAFPVVMTLVGAAIALSVAIGRSGLPRPQTFH